jgi:hypothetical protein
MFAVRDRLMKPLLAHDGLLVFRLNVVDMAGQMDLSVGVVTDEPVPGTQPEVLPAGDYAMMIYVDHGRRANGTLIDWIGGQGLEMDVEKSPDGDRFGCRYEAYLTDPRVERLRTRWQIELAIRLR